MKRLMLLLACLCAVFQTAHAAPPAAVSDPAPCCATPADRKVAAGRLLLKWGPYAERVLRQNRKTWAASIWPLLAAARPQDLQQAGTAVTYEGMRNALLGIYAPAARPAGRAKTAPDARPKALGDLERDLVFTPITPCRVVDTRVTGTPVPANTAVRLVVSAPGGNFIAQGGSSTDCGIPDYPAAVALSVTAMNLTETGFLRVYPADGVTTAGSPVPLFAPNSTVTNDIIVRACHSCTSGLRVYSTATTHYAAFVTGYFKPPRAANLTCVDTPRASVALPTIDMTYSVTSETCPTGTSLVGGSCTSESQLAKLQGNTAYANAYTCIWLNDTGPPTTGYVNARCCRVPGI